ncbi:MAG: hypothetical protein AB7F99_03645 [Vicinamibacterales bacterium]
MTPPPRVLVLGIYLGDRDNTTSHLVQAFDSATDWAVTQHWIALGARAHDRRVAEVTASVVDGRVPKFMLLNQAIAEIPLDEFEYVLISDDDIHLPERFLDRYLRLVERHDFALAQPARTHDSYIDHAFVEQLDGIQARRTNYVEIGPLFSMRQDAARLILPFDESSPMGWGYDHVWPRLLGKAGLKLGLVDQTAVAHTIRKPVAEYSWKDADRQRRDYLARHAHGDPGEVFFIVESYA